MDKKGQERLKGPTETQDDVLTLSDIASYLKVSDKTILRMAQAGEIPSAKVSGQWRFLRSIVHDWLETKMQVASDESLQRVVGPTGSRIPLSRLISPERVVLGVTPAGKEEVLSQLVKPLRDTEIVDDTDAFLAQLVARERMVSTGLGHGLAFPHARQPEKSTVKVPAVILGVCREGADFDSLDGKPTYLFGLCCSPSEIIHLRLLAKLTMLLRTEGMVDKLCKSADEKEIVRHLIAADWELAAATQKEIEQ